MNQRSQDYVATVVGALLGAMAGYLFFTDRGRDLRRRIGPSVEDFARELVSFKGAVARVRDVASEGWRLMDEVESETTRQARPF